MIDMSNAETNYGPALVAWVDSQLAARGFARRSELIKRLSVDPTTVHRWSTGETKSIRVQDVREIATAFDCSSIDVLEGMGFLTADELGNRKVRFEKAVPDIDLALADRNGDPTLTKAHKAALRQMLDTLRTLDPTSVRTKIIK